MLGDVCVDKKKVIHAFKLCIIYRIFGGSIQNKMLIY